MLRHGAGTRVIPADSDHARPDNPSRAKFPSRGSPSGMSRHFHPPPPNPRFAYPRDAAGEFFLPGCPPSRFPLLLGHPGEMKTLQILRITPLVAAGSAIRPPPLPRPPQHATGEELSPPGGSLSKADLF